MNRVLVLGICGGGKSTFARKLHQVTNIPLMHLDTLYWEPNWQETPHSIFEHRLKQWVAQHSQWIIDGNYTSTIDYRLPMADIIFYFDYPAWRSLWRVCKRVWQYYGTNRPDMSAGCHEKIDREFIHYIISFNQKKRPKLFKLLAPYKHTKTIIIFKNDKQVAKYLASLK